jgi:hypothetical protein
MTTLDAIYSGVWPCHSGAKGVYTVCSRSAPARHRARTLAALPYENRAGLAQIVGQVQASDRDLQPKGWANLRNSGQPSENHLPLAAATASAVRPRCMQLGLPPCSSTSSNASSSPSHGR